MALIKMVFLYYQLNTLFERLFLSFCQQDMLFVNNNELVKRFQNLLDHFCDIYFISLKVDLDLIWI